jgi:hypothetical protein
MNFLDAACQYKIRKLQLMRKFHKKVAAYEGKKLQLMLF